VDIKHPMDTRSYKYPRASLQNYRDEKNMFSDLPGEQWIYEAQARHYPNVINGSPGFLSLSNKRFVFEPSTASIMGSPIEIPLDNILELKKTRRLLIIPNSIKIICKDGSNYSFLTWGRNKFYDLLMNPK